METNLYRKYRPNNFDDVVGQKVVVRTLLNSIKNETIAHAYLFSGVRGTGKTSIAKIFARAINCKDSHNPLCGECEICQDFAQSSEVPDIFEIDAASNNGVEEIRKIIDNVKYMPIRMKYKVYIIDEVHMLSKGAFNALLKTLEEPPAHVLFILATTEPNKIPVTILSRVQRFDFGRIDDDLMLDHLCNVLDKEAVSYDVEALKLIVTHAQGGLRDALSLLTKVISFAESVTIETVTESLNLTSKAVTSDLLDNIISHNSQAVSDNFKQLIQAGADAAYLVQDLIEASKVRLIECLSEDPDRAVSYTKIITRLMEALANIKIISNGSLYIEIALIELSLKPKETQVVMAAPTVTPKPVVSEAEKINKLQEQAKLLAEAAKQQPKPEPKPAPEPEKPADEVELQMDILFSNKTGKDVSHLVEEPITETPIVAEESAASESVVETPVVEEPVVEEPITDTVVEDPITDTVVSEPVASESVVETPVIEEPVVASEPEQSIASFVTSDQPVEIVKPVEKDEYQLPAELANITIIDTLKAATKQDKQKSMMAARKAADDLNRDKQYGIAKFFEVSTVQGASSTGIVVSVDQNFYQTYETRLGQITQIYSNAIGSSVKVHLLTTQYWKQERMNFVRAVKENMTVDIFQEATDFFGKDIVNKVNT